MATGWDTDTLSCSGYLRTVSNSAGQSYKVTIYGKKIENSFYTCIGHGANWANHRGHLTIMEIQV